MFQPKGKGSPFCNLSGKTAEVRWLGKPLLDAWEFHMDNNNRMHRVIRLLLRLSIQMEQILEDNVVEHFLPDDVQKEFERMAWCYCQAISTLGRHYHPLHYPVFDFTTKFHYLLHIAKLSKYTNPRRVWCYSEEDMMDKCKKLSRGCINGTGPALVTSKAMKKYVHGMGILFLDH